MADSHSVRLSCIKGKVDTLSMVRLEVNSPFKIGHAKGTSLLKCELPQLAPITPLFTIECRREIRVGVSQRRSCTNCSVRGDCACKMRLSGIPLRHQTGKYAQKSIR